MYHSEKTEKLTVFHFSGVNIAAFSVAKNSDPREGHA